ncbi:DUF805 domain-containing protein [Sphingomonas sp. SUN039]|uniref:DUF805 domain-containing protein n=1 Tax=Sphingomonas sp. SUN039 TaxID=2937787 RepID=UPI002164003A|nr:DUF805 domain-containing protein [Sphingomonas sp. SUN039]UVO53762.1 DUF805 domain-containing protein [Sphingomonas sp. SUN039]
MSETDGTMECPTCHMTVPIAARCEICGSPLPPPPTPPPPVEPEPAPEPEHPPEPEEPEPIVPPEDVEILVDPPVVPDGPDINEPDVTDHPDEPVSPPVDHPEVPDVDPDPTPPPPPPPPPPERDKLQATTSPAMLIAKRLFTDFNFSGRMTRGDFWKMYAARFGVGVVGLVLMGSDEGVQYGETAGPFALLVFLALCVVGVSGVAEGTRRLHDTGQPGVWNLLLLTFVGAVPWLILCAQDGNRDTNRYGPVPVDEL